MVCCVAETYLQSLRCMYFCFFILVLLACMLRAAERVIVHVLLFFFSCFTCMHAQSCCRVVSYLNFSLWNVSRCMSFCFLCLFVLHACKAFVLLVLVISGIPCWSFHSFSHLRLYLASLCFFLLPSFRSSIWCVVISPYHGQWLMLHVVVFLTYTRLFTLVKFMFVVLLRSDFILFFCAYAPMTRCFPVFWVSLSKLCCSAGFFFLPFYVLQVFCISVSFFFLCASNYLRIWLSTVVWLLFLKILHFLDFTFAGNLSTRYSFLFFLSFTLLVFQIDRVCWGLLA